MKNYITLLLLLLFPLYLFSQEITTPEAYSFKEDVFNTLSMYTGTPQISIPIYTIKEKNISIPISMLYVGGAGFKPYDPYSLVGMGWRLNAGGAITRTVNRIPDEYSAYESQEEGYDYLDGFFSFSDENVTSEYVRNNVSAIAPTGDNHKLLGYVPDCEYSPDVFSFSFLGYSGYFLMDYDGNFHIQSTDIVSVEKVDASFGAGKLYDPLYFVLTAKDGTKFTFGSNMNAVEMGNDGANHGLLHMNAWYLTEIQLTNGQTVDFTYANESTSSSAYNKSPYYYVYSDKKLSKSIIWPVTIKTISFSGGEVSVYANLKENNIGGNNMPLYEVDSIKVVNSLDEETYRSYFTYTNKKSNRYHLLTALDINGRNYRFTYYNTSYLPDFSPVGYGTDYWGYYNNQDRLTGVLTFDDMTTDIHLNQTLTIDVKQPSLNYTRTGVLQSITYPTGEESEYYYELNTYNYIGVNSLLSYNLDRIGTQTGGGLRVKEIKTGTMEDYFSYGASFNTDNPTGSPSSGIFYRPPLYTYYASALTNVLSVEGEPSICYSTVTRYRPDGSHTVYHFSSPVDYPDKLNTGEDNFNINTTNNAILVHVYPENFVNALGKNSSCGIERGKLESQKDYNSNDQLVHKKEFTYNKDNNRYNEYVSGLLFVSTNSNEYADLGEYLGDTYLGARLYFSLASSYCIYTFPDYMTQEKETSYDHEGNISISTTTNYAYNDSYSIDSLTQTTSAGDNIIQQIHYPEDINSGVYASMVTRNMLSYPIEQVTTRNNNVTAATLTTYKSGGGSYVPDKVYSLETASSFPSFTYFNGTTSDSHYSSLSEMQFIDYNSEGRLLKTLNKNGLYTYYIWAYNNRYPVAKIETSLNTTIPVTVNDNSLSKSDVLNSIKSDVIYLSGLLSSYLNNSNYLVTIYTYKPLVGMTSSTAPNGVTTYYEYDGFGRLKCIKNDDGNILEQNAYNYAE